MTAATAPTDSRLTGYDTEDRYLATRFRQGSRTVYSIELPLDVIAATMPRPDPHRTMPGNRRVNDSHAKAFGKYVRENEDWTCPALLLRGPDIFSFSTEQRVGSTDFGVMGVPRLARTDLRILDGQHRILGLCYAVDDITRELEERRGLLAAAKNQGSAELEQLHKKEVEKLIRQRQRLHDEQMAIQVLIEEDLKKAEQMFVDIADNALGITSAIRVRFDDRKIVNRCLDAVMKHALLKGRVDTEQDRIGSSSDFLLGAKHVAEIIRTVTVGISGRIGRRLESELKEAAVIEAANDFFDTLLNGFPDLEAVVNSGLTVPNLRASSLLGSTTMMRVIAGAFFELRIKLSDDDIEDFFRALSPHMGTPITKASPWFATQVFAEGASAPGARRQDMDRLAAQIVAWANKRPSWMAAS
jgi:hypothetical protein